MNIKNILATVLFTGCFINSVQSQVTANFTADQSTGCSPITVAFTNTSTGSGTLTYLWDLGNGVTSTETDAGATYSTSGKYTVTLTVNGSAIKTMEITVFKSPIAAFKADKKNICVDQIVKFTDQTVVGDAPITSWKWELGNGIETDGQNQNFEYKYAEKYRINLNVTDKNGCKSTKTEVDYIDVVDRPVADFEAIPFNACTVPIEVTYTNKTTGGGVITYDWVFTSGLTSTDKDPKFTYSNFGSDTVTLTATSDHGCSNDITREAVNITQINATGSISQGEKKILNTDFICADSTGIDFTSEVTGTTSYLWVFGDNTNPVYTLSGNHTYTEAGNYTIMFIASPGISCADTVKWNVTVEKAIANFTLTPYASCKSPTTVQFNNISENAFTYSWTFPDETSTLTNPSHDFSVVPDKDIYEIRPPQDFEIRLRAVSTHGCADYKTETFTILRPTAMFKADTIEGCLPLKVNFTDKSLSDSAIVSYKWDFGDNLTETTTAPTVSHSYTTAGTFNARLTITNTSGCSEISNAITIRVGKIPNPSLKVETTPACSSEPIQLTDLTPAGDSIDFWQYSSGATSINTCSTDKNPLWKFRDEVGSLPITLLVGSNGCYRQTTLNNAITSLGPVGNFSYIIDCANPRTYNFTGSAKGATSYKWNFGDGATATVLNPAHTYAAEGNFTVEFITHNDACPDDTISQMVYARQPSAKFNMKPKGCNNEFIQLSATPSHTIPPVLCREKYLWNFNDSTPAIFTDKDSVKHAFTNRGTYNVKLTVLYDNGCTDSIFHPIRIHKPFASYITDTTKGCSPLTVKFTDTSTKDVNELSEWKLNFDDGNSKDLTSNESVPNVYDIPQTKSYTTTLTVTDTMGCIAVDTIIIEIGYPSPNFTPIETNICAGLPVQFSLEENNLDSVLINFGDGEFSTMLPSPIEHIYNDKGEYFADIKVFKYGCERDLTLNIPVNVQKANAFYTVNDSVLSIITDSVYNCYPKTIHFTPVFGAETVSGRWDFGADNSFADIDLSLEAQKYTYTYSSPGTYYTKLSILTDAGCEDTYNQSIKITGPTGKLTSSTDQACIGDEITLSIKDTANLSKFEWDLGNGQVLSGSKPVTFKYANGGNKNIKLVLYGVGDGVNECITVGDTFNIAMDIIKSKFSINDTFFCEKLLSTFENLSEGQSSQQWIFGDGGTADEVTPMHTYNVGNYIVKLIVNSANGCVDTSEISVTVNPIPSISISKDTIICIGGTASINASGGNRIVWNLPSITDSLTYNFVQQPLNTVRYRATITVDTTQCTNSDSVLVFVQQKPVLTLQPDTTTTIRIENKITLVAKAEVPESNFIWSPNYYLTCTNCSSTDATPLVDTIYTIKIWDQNGCFSDSAKVKILVNDDIVLELPTAFTPLGDAPNNVFKAKIYGHRDSFELKIYNRWGNLVYTSTDENEGWDGKYNGKEQPIDTYVYVAIIKVNGKIQKSIKGTVLLMR